MIQNLHRNYLTYITLIAFVFYQIVNFVYLPIDTIFPDERRFLNESIKFALTNEFWMGDRRAWEMPLTAIIFGSIYKVVNNIDIFIIVVRVFQSVLLIIQAILAYRISQILFEKREIAHITYTIFIFYPFFIFYQSLLLSEMIFNTIVLMAFYMLYKWYQSEFSLNKYFYLVNIIFVFGIYSKGSLSVLPPIVIALFCLLNTKKLRYSIKILLLSCIIYLLLMSLWWVRNYYIFDKFVPFTTSSGANLYLGANPNNKFGGIHWTYDVEIDFVEKTNNLTDEVLINNIYKERALSFISSNPDRYLELMWLKFKRFYSITFNAEKYNTLFYNLLSIFSYGVVLCLAIITIVYQYNNFNKLSAIYLFIGYFTLLHIIFIASIRYRLPIDMFLIILSSFSIYKFVFMKKVLN